MVLTFQNLYQEAPSALHITTPSANPWTLSPSSPEDMQVASRLPWLQRKRRRRSALQPTIRPMLPHVPPRTWQLEPPDRGWAARESETQGGAR